MNISAFKHKKNVGLKFSVSDDVTTLKQKIQTFTVTSMQTTLSILNDLQDKSDNTFNGIKTDTLERANNILANLDEHFRKYFELYTHHKDLPACSFEPYGDLKQSLELFRANIVECRNSALDDILLIKQEIEMNTLELKNGVKLVVERMNQCAHPWKEEESIKCAKRLSHQIWKTVNDIQKISRKALENIVNRIKAIIKGYNNCTSQTVRQAHQKELQFIGSMEACVDGNILSVRNATKLN